MNSTVNLIQEVERLTQALADSNLALMEQTEIAQAANRQAEAAQASAPIAATPIDEQAEFRKWLLSDAPSDTYMKAAWKGWLARSLLAAPQQHAQAAQTFASGAMQAMADAGMDVAVGGEKVKPRGVIGNAQAALSDEPVAWMHQLPTGSFFGDTEHSQTRQVLLTEAEAIMERESLGGTITPLGPILTNRQPAPVASVPAVAAPEGFALVPIKPTPEMIEAGAIDGVDGDFSTLSNGVQELSRNLASSGFRAMLAAAPVAAAVQGDALCMACDGHGAREDDPGEWSECPVCKGTGIAVGQPSTAQPVADAAPRRFNWTRDGMEQAADGAYCYASETKSPAGARKETITLPDGKAQEIYINDNWQGCTKDEFFALARSFGSAQPPPAQGDAPVAVQLRPGVVNYQWPARQTVINGKVIGTIIHDSIDDRSMLISSARAAALEDAAKVCESKLQYPGDDAGVDTALHEAISAIRGLAANPAE